jgi:hypothetical protein
MSLLRCSMHDTRQPGRLSHVYWFMPMSDGTVLRKRQRLCHECLNLHVIELLTPEDAENLTCPACGISTEEDVSPVYVTYYPPGFEGVRGAMAFCDRCAIEARLRACHNADDLPDRLVDLPDQAVAQPVSAEAAFRAIGRRDPGLKHGPSGYLYPPSALPPEAAG